MYGGFACIDPDASCVDDDIVTAEMLDLCDAGQIGNGYCDDSNNNPECGMIRHLIHASFILVVACVSCTLGFWEFLVQVL